MPKIKAPFEMPTIDHSKQRMKLSGVLEGGSSSVRDGNFPGLGKVSAFGGKIPKTMSFAGTQGPLIKEGMFRNLENELSPKEPSQ